VFADTAGPVRDIAVRKNGDVIVGVLDQRRERGGVLVFRDANHDGVADDQEKFGDAGVHGVVLSGDSILYVSTAHEVIRYRLTDSLLPKKRVDTVITGLPSRQIPSHTLAIDVRGNLLVNIGANSNACAGDGVGAKGRDPCVELDSTGGVWSFKTDRNNQTLKDGTRVATGLHNAVALAVNPRDTMIYAVSHGRDGLHDAWPQLYTEEEAATSAAEEMIRIQSSHADYGWPYCYYDYIKQQLVLAPEYGGDKSTGGRCDRIIQPLMSYPAHWSPMSIVFYSGKMFPSTYGNGAFIAFHGSSMRAPEPEEGYQIVFQQFKDGMAADYSVFASGFLGGGATAQSADHRPIGLAVGADGALYVTDDKGGRIWRVTYK
jgi:glucose/arabinose dehydrogenase